MTARGPSRRGRRAAALGTLGALAAACAAGPPAATGPAVAPAAPARPWRELFDGRSLAGWVATDFGGQGDVTVADGALHLDFGNPLTGVTWSGPPPSGDYELEVVAAREEGTDFFCGLTFPVGDAHLTLVLGGWGGSVSGLSSLDGRDANHNATRRLHGFVDRRDYTARVAVTQTAVRVWLDGAPFCSAELAGHELGLRPEVLQSRPLGVASFATRARIRSVRWRALGDGAGIDANGPRHGG